MFRNKIFTVRRRFSDFLGLYEKLSEKHGPNGFIVPPPPEKSILGRLLTTSRNTPYPQSFQLKDGMFVLGRNDEGEGGKGGFVLGRLR